MIEIGNLTKTYTLLEQLAVKDVSFCQTLVGIFSSSIE